MTPGLPPEQASFEWACPLCRAALQPAGENELFCRADRLSFFRLEGIWRFLPPERQQAYQQFVNEYETVRKAEGRGANDPACYRALPFEDLSEVRAQDWRIRAASFRVLVKRVVNEMGRQRSRPLLCLDLGAGNGWLSYRLARLGHRVGAVDLLTNRWDGLGAWEMYDAPFTPVQAEFDRLPLAGNQVDLAIFNASFHYSVDYQATLMEAMRVLKAGGRVVILDSPLYTQADSGRQMVRERQQHFTQAYGFPSDALDSENFLTYQRLDELSSQVGIQWQFIQPFYGWRWALRPWIARLRGLRQPARFCLLGGRKSLAG
jgi:SAM-dependent methyltransferase